MRNAMLLATVAATSCLQLTACAGDDEHDDGALMEQAYEDGSVDGKTGDIDCSGVRVPDRSGFNKRIALTFDDGPNPATTPQVIDILHKHHVPATFFNNGVRYTSQAAKDIAAQIAADPDFMIGNHSQNHINLAEQSAARVATEIDRTDVLIREAGETPKYFRFPFGSATCASKKQAQDRGYLVTGWHIDSADWCYAAGHGHCANSTFKYVPDSMRDDMLAYVLSQVHSTGGGIILFHDIHQSTADHLDAVLTTLEGEGYTFVRLDDTAVFPRLNGVQPPAQKFIGDACTRDADCGFTVLGRAGTCHPAGFCTIPCAGSCPDLDGKAPTFCILDQRTANTGTCASKPAAQNNLCALLPDTENRVEARFVGTSGASAANSNVCAPR